MRTTTLALRGIAGELRPMLRLATPVVAAELAWMSMGVVDTMMVGRLNPEAIGAVSIGRGLFLFVAIFGIGVLLSLDTLVSNAFGARDLRECNLSLIQGLYLCAVLALPVMLVVRMLTVQLGSWGVNPAVLAMAVPYLKAVSWCALPLFLYAALRRYLQAMNLVRPVMIALISANAINALGNWILIFGNLGAPALGTTGAGWATFLATLYLALFLAAVVWIHERQERAGLFDVSWLPDFRRLRRLLGLGLPIALQLMLELGVFTLATVIVARLDAASLAAHQIALTAASITYMVPLGISSAGAVRVGQALGRKDPLRAARSGWTALALGAAFMLLAAAVFVLFPRPLIRLFSPSEPVVAIGVKLLLVAAVFQLFDGVQVVATGVLRGTGDTRTPLYWNLVGYWVFGLPVGFYLCFSRGMGAIGIWIGLSVGLIVVALVLLRSWSSSLDHA